MLGSMMLAGCSTSEDVDHTYTGKKLYELVKINLNETEKKYVERNNDFAFKLFKNVSEMENKEPGFLVSPLSVTYVLGMINNGAGALPEKKSTACSASAMAMPRLSITSVGNSSPARPMWTKV